MYRPRVMLLLVLVAAAVLPISANINQPKLLTKAELGENMVEAAQKDYQDFEAVAQRQNASSKLSVTAELTARKFSESNARKECLAKVDERCHKERTQCTADCDLLAQAGDASLVCAVNKCAMLHQACHKVYAEVCDDYLPTVWLPVEKLNDELQAKKMRCKQMVTKKCDQKALLCEQQCKADAAESDGADVCEPSRCSELRRTCLVQHDERGVCEAFDRYVKAEQQPGKFCFGHADDCWKGFQMPRIVDKCKGDCEQGDSWSDITSCRQCSRAASNCISKCQDEGCDLTVCYNEHRKCSITCPYIRALAIARDNTTVANLTVSPKVPALHCKCGRSDGDQKCNDPCKNKNILVISDFVPVGTLPDFGLPQPVKPARNEVVIDITPGIADPDSQPLRFRPDGAPVAQPAPALLEVAERSTAAPSASKPAAKTPAPAAAKAAAKVSAPVVSSKPAAKAAAVSKPTAKVPAPVATKPAAAPKPAVKPITRRRPSRKLKRSRTRRLARRQRMLRNRRKLKASTRRARKLKRSLVRLNRRARRIRQIIRERSNSSSSTFGTVEKAIALVDNLSPARSGPLSVSERAYDAMPLMDDLPIPSLNDAEAETEEVLRQRKTQRILRRRRAQLKKLDGKTRELERALRKERARIRRFREAARKQMAKKKEARLARERARRALLGLPTDTPRNANATASAKVEAARRRRRARASLPTAARRSNSTAAATPTAASKRTRDQVRAGTQSQRNERRTRRSRRHARRSEGRTPDRQASSASPVTRPRRTQQQEELAAKQRRQRFWQVQNTYWRNVMANAKALMRRRMAEAKLIAAKTNRVLAKATAIKPAAKTAPKAAATAAPAKAAAKAAPRRRNLRGRRRTPQPKTAGAAKAAPAKTAAPPAPAKIAAPPAPAKIAAPPAPAKVAPLAAPAPAPAPAPAAAAPVAPPAVVARVNVAVPASPPAAPVVAPAPAPRATVVANAPNARPKRNKNRPNRAAAPVKLANPSVLRKGKKVRRKAVDRVEEAAARAQKARSRATKSKRRARRARREADELEARAAETGRSSDLREARRARARAKRMEKRARRQEAKAQRVTARQARKAAKSIRKLEKTQQRLARVARKYETRAQRFEAEARKTNSPQAWQAVRAYRSQATKVQRQMYRSSEVVRELRQTAPRPPPQSHSKRGGSGSGGRRRHHRFSSVADHMLQPRRADRWATELYQTTQAVSNLDLANPASTSFQAVKSQPVPAEHDEAHAWPLPTNGATEETEKLWSAAESVLNSL